MEKLYKLSDKILDDYIKFKPIIGTTIGVHKYDSEWGNFLHKNTQDYIHFLIKYIIQLRKININENDLILVNSYKSIEYLLHNNIRQVQYKDYYYDLNSIECSFHRITNTFDFMIYSPNWSNIISRLEKLHDTFKQYIYCLDEGRRLNHLVSKRQVYAVLKHTKKYTKTYGESLINKCPADLKPKVSQLIHQIRSHTFPMFMSYLKRFYLPSASIHDSVKDRYTYYVRFNVGKKIDLKQVYLNGFKEIYTLIQEINTVAKLINPTLDYTNIYEYCKTNGEKVANIREFIARIHTIQKQAIQKLDNYFDIPEKAKIVDIKESPLDTITAYYYPPSSGFTRPGTIYYKFEENKLIELFKEVTIAYHEGFPGHHLQLSIQVANDKKLNSISRLLSESSGFCEGWALYSERLMYELNMFDKPEYIIGMLFASLHRACRIVIDIGIHCEWSIPEDSFFKPNHKWNYDLGVSCLVEIAKLNRSYAKDEVTRYCGIPGQALCYKIGEWAIRDYRRKYFEKVHNIHIDTILNGQNKTFNPLIVQYLKEFHKIVLNYGSVTLEQFERNMDWFIQNKCVSK
jgi:uncharacterized protein (DUF885 family)